MRLETSHRYMCIECEHLCQFIPQCFIMKIESRCSYHRMFLGFIICSLTLSLIDHEFLPNKQTTIESTDHQHGFLQFNREGTVNIYKMRVNPINITEYLFFSIFGQKDTNDFAIALKQNLQPVWTIYFFKVSFSLYMLVTVIVLMNLLIAMMSDTYHNIQSQSDTEWKYGLSKLVRKMQKTTTAPSPLNLVATWVAYIGRTCKKERITRQRTGRSRGYMEPAMHQNDFPKSTNNKILPTSRTKGSVNFSLLQTSPADSQWSLNNVPKIENVVEWDTVRRKYRVRFGGEIEKPSDGETTLAAIA